MGRTKEMLKALIEFVWSECWMRREQEDEEREAVRQADDRKTPKIDRTERGVVSFSCLTVRLLPTYRYHAP